MVGAMAVVYLLPILFGDDKFNLHTLKVFLLFFVLLPFIIYAGLFVYFAPYKLWLDIRRNKEEGRHSAGQKSRRAGPAGTQRPVRDV